MDYIKKIEKTKKSMIEVYFELQIEYTEKFGEKTIVLFENGKFFEIYGTNELGKAREITDLLNIALTRKDKESNTIDIKTPYMAGFPTMASDRHIDILLENDWTIVMVEQITNPPNPERAVTKILSKTTNIDNVKSFTDNYILSLYFTIEKNGTVCCGWSVIDIFIGKLYVDDIHTAYEDEIHKLCLFFRPKEVLVNIVNYSKEEKDILEHLSLPSKVITRKDFLSDINNSIAYQNKYFSTIFRIKSLLSPIEVLNLEMKEHARKSMLSLLKYCEEYNPVIIHSLQLPKPFDHNDYVRLENNAIEQLELYNTNGKNLFNILNKTSTDIGKRYLLDNLLHPICNVGKLNERYSYVEKFLSYYSSIEGYLKEFYDLEKFNRKWCISRLQPYELFHYYSTLEKIRLCSHVLKDIYPFEFNETIIKEIEDIFDIPSLKKSCLKNIYLPIFKHDDEMNVLFTRKQTLQNTLYEICNIINKKCEDSFKLEYTESNMYYLKTTNKKWETFEKKITGKEFSIGENIVQGKEFRKDHSMKSYAKIVHPFLSSLSFAIDSVKEEINRKSTEKFLACINELYAKYSSYLEECVLFIQQVDFYTCLAKISDIYSYTKPSIVHSEHSFVEFKEIRHPILERLNNKIFVPNDVCIHNKNILLYGCNSSGKSVLLKAVGLSIILAQIGSFVPCSNMTFYPFKKIYTRILTNDNIFQGHSSFMTEMIELKRILDNSDMHTISLCDELTHGTESSSGTSIMIATLLELCKKSNFFFTSHLHNVYEHPLIKQLIENKLSILHMSVEYDKQKDCIVYDRKLKEGGGNKLYGVEFLKALHFDIAFLDTCLEIRDTPSEKISKYNKDIVVDSCTFCKSKENLHTHHIQEQHLSNQYGMIGTIHKNNTENLVVLCEKCHILTHKNDIEIQYKDTTSGKVMEMTLGKITDKEMVLELRKEKKTQKQIKEILESKGIKLSIKKISEFMKE
jgi:DNA mismatch repair protein MutS